MTATSKRGMGLRLANASLHATHIAVIAFSVVGWVSPATRPYHLMLAAGTAVSWFVLGPLISDPGYCAVTGLQQAVWRRMGVADPPSYVPYLVERVTGRVPDPVVARRVTQWTFFATTTASVALAVVG